MGAFRTQNERACVVVAEDVVLRRAELLGLRQHHAVIHERVARGGRAVLELASDVLVDDAELDAVQPCLLSEHCVNLSEGRGLRDVERVAGEAGAGFDDLVCAGDAVQLVEVDERELGVETLRFRLADEGDEVADDVSRGAVAPIDRGLLLLMVIDIVVEVEFVGVGRVGGGRELQHASVGCEHPRDELQLCLYACCAEVDVFAPKLHQLGCVFVLREGEFCLVVLDFGARHLARDADEGDVALCALEDGATLALDCAVVGVQVGSYVSLGELIGQRLPVEAGHFLDREICAEKEGLHVQRVQASLYHLLAESVDEGINYCCHCFVGLEVDYSAQLLGDERRADVAFGYTDYPRIRVDVALGVEGLACAVDRLRLVFQL